MKLALEANAANRVHKAPRASAAHKANVGCKVYGASVAPKANVVKLASQEHPER